MAISKYRRIAGDQMDAVSIHEQAQRDKIDYDENHVRQAIVHSREDLVGIFSLLDSLNQQVKLLRIIVVLLLVTLWGWFAWGYFHQ